MCWEQVRVQVRGCRWHSACTAGWARAQRLHQRLIPCEKSEGGDVRDPRTATSVGELVKRDRVGSHAGSAQGLRGHRYSGRQTRCVIRRGFQFGDNGFQLPLVPLRRGHLSNGSARRSVAGDGMVFDREQLQWSLTMIEVPAEPSCGECPKSQNVRPGVGFQSCGVQRGVLEDAARP